MYTTVALIHYPQEFFHIVNEYLKLEKVVFGGIKGGGLTEMVEQMFTEFTDLSSQMTSKSYNPLLPDNKASSFTASFVHLMVYCSGV